MLTNFSYSTTIDLNSIMSEFDKSSNFVKRVENEKAKIQIEKDGLKSDKWKNVDLKLNSAYDITYNGTDSLEIADSINKGNLTAELGYRGFYIKSHYSYTTDRYEVIENRVYKYPYYYVLDEFSIGYKKVLNDFLYSEDDYKENSAKLKEKVTDYKSKAKIIEKKEEIIDKYAEIKNDELEVLLKKSQLTEMEETLNILKTKVEISESTKIDFNIMRLEMNKTKEELNYLQKNILVKKKVLFNIVGIKEETTELEDLNNIEDKDVSVTDSSLIALQEELNLEKEGLKYIKRQNQWPLEAFAQYETVEEKYQVGLNFNLDLFKYHVEEKQKKQDIETKPIEIEDEKINRENILQERTTKLMYFKENVKTCEELANVYSEKHKLTRDSYIQGDTGLLDYLKTQTEAYKANTEYLKTKNNYCALLYKILINGGNN